MSICNCDGKHCESDFLVLIGVCRNEDACKGQEDEKRDEEIKEAVKILEDKVSLIERWITIKDEKDYDYQKMIDEVRAVDKMLEEERNLKKLKKECGELLIKMQDLKPEYKKLINEHFWELI